VREFGQPRLGLWQWLGRVPYSTALQLQSSHRDRVIEGTAQECLYLLEHPPVITLGRSANPSNILANPRQLAVEGIDVFRTARGGEVTFHGPGQLVGYPIFRLSMGLRAYMETMAAAVQDVLLEYGIASEWRADRPGLWVGNSKLCAFGVHIRSRVTMHGFALNVHSLKTGFSHIVPCGLANADVGSMEDCLGWQIPVMDVALKMPEVFSRRFGILLSPRVDVSAQMQGEIIPQ
jgi:lipoyl(octanoyl) transferase